jgi:hypothetical protein
MAKVVLTLEDQPDGNVKVTPQFDPKYNVDNPTGAEYVAMRYLMYLSDTNFTGLIREP